jgi:LPXTG-site transpeptidase (sortase) family protein
MNAAKKTAAFIQAIQRASDRKWSFLVVFLVVLFVTVEVCMATGFVPDNIAPNTAVATAAASGVTLENSPIIAGVPLTNAANNSGVSANTNGALNMNGELPTRVVIPSIGVNTLVTNPDTLNVDALDSYLSYSAARYPTSATLDQQGNVIIFGHSSYLPVVINQHYKTFDGIQNLKPGDLIDVYSATNEYVYSVDTEQKESELTDGIPLTTTGHTLTLSTCDSFTTKTDRFIVTATLVSSSPLGSK